MPYPQSRIPSALSPGHFGFDTPALKTCCELPERRDCAQPMHRANKIMDMVYDLTKIPPEGRFFKILQLASKS